MIGLLLVLACGSAEVVPEPVVVPAHAEEQPVVEAPVPEGPAAVRVLHTRVDRRSTIPEHVSATWITDGLQVMVTGFHAPCEPAPAFVGTQRPGKITLALTAADDAADCDGRHIVMMQLDGQQARDLTLEVLRRDGSVFGSATVAATDH